MKKSLLILLFVLCSDLAASPCSAITSLAVSPFGLVSGGQRGLHRVEQEPNVSCSTDADNLVNNSSLDRIDVTVTGSVNGRLWAAGYGAYMAVSEDAGSSWNRVVVAEADQLPILDILFTSDQRGYAVGALGLLLVSYDGGSSWKRKTVYIDPEWEEPDDLALNSIVKLNDGTLIIAAEAGAVYRSGNQGQTWDKLDTGYEGSYFKALPIGRRGVLVAGLGGQVSVSRDAGDSWENISPENGQSIFAVQALNDGEVLLAGAHGKVYKTEGGATKTALLEGRLDGAISDLALYKGKVYAATSNGLRLLDSSLR